MEWLNGEIAYWHWIVVGLLLAALEIFVPSFVILWFGLAAIVVGLIMAVTSLSFTFQLLIWVILSVLFAYLWHKIISPKILNKTFAGMSREAIIGQTGTVLNYNALQSRGMLRFSAPLLGNDEWEFIFEGELQSGDRVTVIDVSGNTLIVTNNK
ncbi:MAG: NfeD family protein [Exilibacterium sp.]